MFEDGKRHAMLPIAVCGARATLPDRPDAEDCGPCMTALAAMPEAPSYLMAEDDGSDEPTIWLTVGPDDPAPLSVVSRADLHPAARDLWPFIVARLCGGAR
jgi:hypothetical protein